MLLPPSRVVETGWPRSWRLSFELKVVPSSHTLGILLWEMMMECWGWAWSSDGGWSSYWSLLVTIACVEKCSLWIRGELETRVCLRMKFVCSVISAKAMKLLKRRTISTVVTTCRRQVHNDPLNVVILTVSINEPETFKTKGQMSGYIELLNTCAQADQPN
jgi:hypothetical protein